MNDRELTVEEAATELGVSRETIRKRIQRGEMGARRAGARMLLIPRLEVERWREIGKIRPGPQGDVSFEHGGFRVRGRLTTTDDGRFGRAWLSIYERANDDRRVFAVVALVDHTWAAGHGKHPQVAAFEEAQQLVKRLIDTRTFVRGILYDRRVGREGQPREAVGSLGHEPR